MIARRKPRLVCGEGFKEARLIAGLTRKMAADLLGVTRRTICNWEARRVRVPYSSFKLMRILSGYALPGEAWRGWCVRGDALWSPEQRSFRPLDLAFWGLTVAMARAWKQREGRELAPDRVLASVEITSQDFDPGGVLAPANPVCAVDVGVLRPAARRSHVTRRKGSLCASVRDGRLSEFVTECKGAAAMGRAPARPMAAGPLNLCREHLKPTPEKPDTLQSLGKEENNTIVSSSVMDYE